jgi:hypothetical protein
VGAVTSQRVLNVLFYVNILQCFFVVENFTANAVSVAIGDNEVIRRGKRHNLSFSLFANLEPPIQNYP